MLLGFLRKKTPKAVLFSSNENDKCHFSFTKEIRFYIWKRRGRHFPINHPKAAESLNVKRSHLIPALPKGKEIPFPTVSGSQLVEPAVEHQVWRGRSMGAACALLQLCHPRCQVTVKRELGPVNFGEQFPPKGGKGWKNLLVQRIFGVKWWFPMKLCCF